MIKKINRLGFSIVELSIVMVILGVLFYVRGAMNSNKARKTTSQVTHQGAEYSQYPEVITRNYDALKMWGNQIRRRNRNNSSKDAKAIKEIAQLTGIKERDLCLFASTQSGSALAAGGIIIGEAAFSAYRPKFYLNNQGRLIPIAQPKMIKHVDAPLEIVGEIALVGTIRSNRTEELVFLTYDQTGGYFKGRTHKKHYKYHLKVDETSYPLRIEHKKSRSGYVEIRGTVESKAQPLVAYAFHESLYTYGRKPPRSSLGEMQIITYQPIVD